MNDTNTTADGTQAANAEVIDTDGQTLHVAVNGGAVGKAAPNERTIQVQSAQEIRSGAQGMINTQFLRACELKAVRVSEHTKVVSIMLGAKKIEGDDVLERVAELNPVAARQYLIVLVANLGEETRTIEGEIVVANEQINTSAGRPQGQSSVQGAALGGAVRRPPAEQIKPRRAETNVRRFMKRENETADVNVRRPAGRQTSTGGTAKSGPLAGVSTQTGGSPTARHLQTSGLDMVSPSEGEHVVLLLLGHAMGLESTLRNNVPIFRTFRPAMATQLDSALVRNGAVGVGTPGEVVVALKRTDIIRLLAFVRGQSGPVFGDGAQRIADAIQRAIQKKNRVASGEQTTRLLEAGTGT